MIYDCPNSQFMSRNLLQIANVITGFRELNDAYDNQLILSLCSDGWEIHDLRANLIIIKHPFKHVKQMCEDMYRFKKSYIDLGCLKIRVGKLPTLPQSYSIRHIINVYGYDEYFFSTNYLKQLFYGYTEKKAVD